MLHRSNKSIVSAKGDRSEALHTVPKPLKKPMRKLSKTLPDKLRLGEVEEEEEEEDSSIA